MNIPKLWENLVCAINDKITNLNKIRDVNASCVGFNLDENNTKQFGDCSTDGHYLCVECVQISLQAYRHHKDQCEDCGAKLINNEYGSLDKCSANCIDSQYVGSYKL